MRNLAFNSGNRKISFTNYDRQRQSHFNFKLTLIYSFCLTWKLVLREQNRANFGDVCCVGDIGTAATTPHPTTKPLLIMTAPSCYHMMTDSMKAKQGRWKQQTCHSREVKISTTCHGCCSAAVLGSEVQQQRSPRRRQHQLAEKPTQLIISSIVITPCHHLLDKASVRLIIISCSTAEAWTVVSARIWIAPKGNCWEDNTSHHLVHCDHRHHLTHCHCHRPKSRFTGDFQTLCTWANNQVSKA